MPTKATPTPGVKPLTPKDHTLIMIASRGRGSRRSPRPSRGQKMIGRTLMNKFRGACGLGSIYAKTMFGAHEG
jgi:hypothetical protein